MKTYRSTLSVLSIAGLVAFVSLASPVLADPATGWRQTGAGPYDYNDAANWVGGVINGVFGSDLTLTANQTITFAADTALPDGLNIAYKGKFALTFQSDGTGAKTLTLGDNITCVPSDNDAGAYVTFGSATAANDLTINLGGAQRMFTIGNVWHQRGALQNGTFILLAGNGRNGYFHCYSAANNFTGPVTVNGDPNFVHLSFQTAGALPDGVTILLLNHGMIQGAPSAGYACGTLLANGRIDPASTGGIAFVNNENVDVDLTDYPNLSIGTSGNSNYYGHITPANGVYRFCSASHVYLGAENALTGKADVLVEMPSAGTSLYLDKRNDVEGTVTVVNCGLILRTDAGSLPNAKVHMHGGNFYINPASDSGTRRTEYVHLHGSTLTYNGHSSKETLDYLGELVLDIRDPAYGVIGGVNHINLTANGKFGRLHVDTLTRTNSAIWRLGGKYDNNNNRLRIGGAAGENTMQLTVGNAAEIQSALVGGGGSAGTTTISVYPFGFANVGTYYDSLLTYGSTGFRALDYETEFATTITPGTVSQENVRLPVGSTTEITSDTTVNAVFLQGSDPNKGSTSLTGDGTLTVSSGVLVMGYHRNAKPIVNCAAVNFGDHPGVISYARGKGSDWNAALQGSAGAIFWQTSDSAGYGSGGSGVTISGANIAASTLTGDVVMHGYVACNSNGAFPGGATRPGNLYVNAYCSLLDGDGFNGIFGIGHLYRNNDTIVMGADNSNGDFAGSFALVDPTPRNCVLTTTLVKEGAGRQRLSGSSAHTGTTTANAGVLQVDGALTASAVTVADGATLGGVGSFDKAVTVADGGILEAGSAEIAYADDHSLDFGNTLALSGDATLRVKVYDKDALATVTAAAVTGTGTLTVAMDSGDYTGTFLVLKSDAALPCTFAKGANCGHLALRNDGTELWVNHEPATFVLVR